MHVFVVISRLVKKSSLNNRIRAHEPYSLLRRIWLTKVIDFEVK